MDYSSFLPPEIAAKMNIISIHTGRTPEEVFCVALGMGLDMLEQTVTQQYGFVKIDQDGNVFDLTGEPLKR